MFRIAEAFIDGALVEPCGREEFELVDPTREETVGRVVLADGVDLDKAVAAAHRAFEASRRSDPTQRIVLLRRIAEAVLARRAELVRATVEEYGGPVRQAEWRVAMAAESLTLAANLLESYAFSRPVGDAIVLMEPVGVAGLITPWNNNVGFVCGKLAAALAAGCACVVKPSELSARQTQVLIRCLQDADLPAGLVNIVIGGGQLGAALVAHPGISKISFTGSTAVGQSILRTGADTVKRVTLELGGKSPTLVLDDADFEKAVPFAIGAAFGNNGQACVAGARILVPRSRFDDFAMRLKAAAEALVVGDPRDDSVDIGPQVSRRHYERVQGYIRLGLAEGARLLTGGEGRPGGLSAGYFTRPTVFVDVRNDMRIAQEEIFGPVVCLIAYSDEADAVAIANDSSYGLQAYVSTGDPSRGRRVAALLEAGRVAINAAPAELQAPFGGRKLSGLGREYGLYGLESFLEPKALIGEVSA